jgi:predicted ATPase
VNLRLGFAGDEFGYLIDLGLPEPGKSAFGLDPEIEHECVWHAEQTGCRSITLEKTFGETAIAGAKELGAPPWRWPGR